MASGPTSLLQAVGRDPNEDQLQARAELPKDGPPAMPPQAEVHDPVEEEPDSQVPIDELVRDNYIHACAIHLQVQAIHGQLTHQRNEPLEAGAYPPSIRGQAELTHIALMATHELAEKILELL